LDSRRQSYRFETPPGTEWSEILIRFLDGNTVTIAVDSKTERYTFAEMNMKDGRNGKAVSRSYGKLGYERVKKAPPEGGKHVILRASAGQSYVSVYDSDNATLDNGELKDLALAASKALKTAAVFTSLYDSDTYEFIVFANGRQVDMLMTDAESYTGPLKRLRDKSRAAKWSALFGRTLTAEQIAQAATGQTVFSDAIVGGLSKLIGLSGQPQINYQDCLEEEGAISELEENLDGRIQNRRLSWRPRCFARFVHWLHLLAVC
jgi:hypothetical protein